MTVFLCTMLFHVKLLLLLLLAALPRETTEETDKQADIMKPVQVFGGNVRCGAKMISRWPNRNITECYKCPLCRRSQGSTVICNNINILKSPTELQKKIRCEKCQKGRTYSPKKSHKMCLQCTKCKPNHKVLKNCTPRSNTVCGGCMDDSYEHITAFGMKTCEKCGLCCNDGKDSRIKECTKKGLPTKQACSRSDAERCKQKRPPKPAAKTTATSSINLSTAKRRSSRTITNTPSSQYKHLSNEQVIPTSPITQHSTEQLHAVYINNSNSINTNSIQTELIYILVPTIVGVIVLLLFLLFAIPRIIKWYHKRTVKENTSQEFSQMQRDGSSTGEETLPLHVPSLHNNQRPEEQLSTTVYKWLNNRHTHIRESYKTICLTMDAVINKDRFKTILCSLGLSVLEAAQFYPNEGKRDFNSALSVIISSNPHLKMEKLAEIFQNNNCNDLANLVREEDQRMANESANHGKMKRPALIRGESFSETVEAEEDHNVDQCSTTANPGLG